MHKCNKCTAKDCVNYSILVCDQLANFLSVADLCDQDRIMDATCKATTSSLAIYTSKMRKCATSLSRDNYAIAKQRNVALFSARMPVASDDSKFFIGVLKNGAYGTPVQKVGSGTPLTPEN